MNKQQDIYIVDWISSDGTSVLRKSFTDQNKAIEFHNSTKDSIVLKLTKKGQEAYQYQILPTIGGKDFMNAIQLRRKLKEKGALINREGISSVSLEYEMKNSQTARLIAMAVVPSVTIYTALKYKELPSYIKLGLIMIGSVSFYVNGRNYLSNLRKK